LQTTVRLDILNQSNGRWR